MNKSILLVDENADVLALLTLLFEQRGVRTLRARSHAEALEMLGRAYIPVDLVLVNRNMPRLCESAFAAEVSHLRPLVPLVFMGAGIEDGVIRIEGAGTGGRGGVTDLVAAALSAVPEGARVS